MYYFTVFVRSGILQHVPLHVFGSGSYKVAVRMLARVAVTWGPEWGWRISFHVGSLTWLLAGGFSSSPHGSLHRSVWDSLRCVTWLSPEQAPQKRLRWKWQCFLQPNLGSFTVTSAMSTLTLFLGGYIYKGTWIPGSSDHWPSWRLLTPRGGLRILPF